MNKAIITGVSVILVIGVVIGIVASVTHKKHSDNKDSGVSSTNKAITAICSPTDYKEACVNGLSSVANNESATPKDLIIAAINITIEYVKSGSAISQNIRNTTNDPTQKMALDDCKELLQYAVDELQASITTVGDSEMHTISDREAELKNWLSAVISYQQTCLDGVTHPELKNAVENGLVNATQLTSNALAIVSAISDILTAFKIPIPQLNPNSGRKLLEDPEVTNHGGFPTWFSAGDRKLLAMQATGNLRPNAVVAIDGSGQFKSIAAALAAYPKNNRGRYVIYVKAGIYNEYITVTKDQVNIFMYGDGPRRTIVTGRKNNRDGVSTFQTASFATVADGFIAKSMGFQNTAGPEGHQAVALRVQSDMAAFFNCRMDGYQDTLYAQTHRQFYRNCIISGTVDFIFGDSATLIQNCQIIVRKPMAGQQNTVTAHGRTDKRETTGIVIQNSVIVPERRLFPVRFQIPTYLGRPWKEYSRTVIMGSRLGDFINPAGWMPWAGNFALDTLYYAEYANTGPGAVTTRRVRWKGYHVITNSLEALQFTAAPFIQGNLWLKNTGAPFILGLRS